MSVVPRFLHVTFPLPRGPHGPVVNFVAARPRPAAVSPPTTALGPLETAFVQHVLACVGVDASAYRPETLVRRFGACLRALGARDVGDAWRLVAADRRSIDVAIESLLIGVTAFFRDAPVFARLEDDVLPGLLASGRPLRVWSVGCSDGAELYSIAILLAERDRLDGSFLLGTDCRPTAVARARAGRFDAGGMAELAPARLARWFERHGTHWLVDPFLRAATRWWTADVLTGVEPGSWDVILCRNLGIYLRPGAANEVWAGLGRALRRGGVLVVGRGERPIVAQQTFSPIGPGLYRRDATVVARRHAT